MKRYAIALLVGAAVCFAAGCESRAPGGKGESYSLGQRITSCRDCLSGLFEPLKDMQSFEDDRYTEVAVTDRGVWDKKRLPKEMLALEAKGYRCTPLPLEYAPQQGANQGVLYMQRSVTNVRWMCELPYQGYKFFKSDALDQKRDFARKGFTCVRQNCVNDDKSQSHVWFCYH